MLTRRVFLIAGSRDYPNKQEVLDTLNQTLQAGDVVIAGGAKGVDTWAAETAATLGCRVEVMLADWQRYGRSAGMKRNEAMLQRMKKAQDLGWTALVICFWDRESRGTAHTIQRSQDLRLDLQVVVPN